MKDKETIFSVFASTLKIKRDLVSESTIISEIVPDSLTYFELFIQLEKIIGRPLDFESVITIHTLGDAHNYIKKNV